MKSFEHSSEFSAGIDPSSSVPYLGGIFMKKLSSVDSWLQQEEEYLRQFTRAPSDLDRDLHHQMLQLSVLTKVRLQQV